MASVFAITTTREKIESENGSATAVFTVTNDSSKRIRGVAKIKPLGDTERAWLKIDGQSERDYDAKGTEQFTVNFNYPGSEEPSEEAAKESQPAKSFPFRFDVVSSLNPDEDFTEGPTVTVEIPEKTVEEEKPFPIWIPIVAGVLLLSIIGGVVGYLLTRETKVKVPNVIGKTFEEAEQTLKDNKLKAKKVEDKENLDKEINKVFDQDPKEDAEVSPDSFVNLSLPATTTVPDLTGKTYVEASNLLLDNNLRLKSYSGEPTLKDGKKNTIVSQNPTADENKPVIIKTAVHINFKCIRIKITDCRKVIPGFNLLDELVPKSIERKQMEKVIDKSIADPNIKN